MINEKYAKTFCKDDISKIENYDKAIADTTQTWICHHRLGLTLDGEFAHSKEDLIRMGMYYGRPYFELIFLTKSEHDRLHKTGKNNPRYGKTHSAETKAKMSEAKKGENNYMYGRTHSEVTLKKMSESRKGKPISDFGKKFKAHYGKTNFEDAKLYDKEHHWYRHHNKTCRWEKA